MTVPDSQDRGVHRRFDPLSGQWVLVSTNRTKRPWQGHTESSTATQASRYDKECYLCPGNARANGETNPAYEGTFVFTNDFPALTPQDPAAVEPVDDGLTENGPAGTRPPPPLFRFEPVTGTCRVMCFSERHDLSLSQLDPSQIHRVIDEWARQSEELGQIYPWVQVFENRGDAMGASNSHPHGQLWASSSIPTLIQAEESNLREYHQKHESLMLEDYVEAEVEDGSRIVVKNDDWVAVVPYWAVWPFETLILPRFHVTRLPDLGTTQRTGLASLIKDLLVGYDRLFNAPFPYSMGWHGAPFTPEPDQHWLLHAHVYPPLLRSASVRKFMVGYELLAEAQRDLSPEAAAESLRRVID